MNRAIAFFEALGRDVDLAEADPAQLAAAAQAAQLPAELVAALISRDRTRIETLLGARTNIVCAVFPVREPDKDDDGKEDDAPPVEPDKTKGTLAVAA